MADELDDLSEEQKRKLAEAIEADKREGSEDWSEDPDATVIPLEES